MKTVGNKFPQFNVKATISTDLNSAFTEINQDSYKGKWLWRLREFSYSAINRTRVYGSRDRAYWSH